MNNHYWARYRKFVCWLDGRPCFSGYTEVHHIIPKSLGGSDKKDNLIRVDSREHYICHLLLKKALPCKQTYGAFYAMASCSSGTKVLTSKEYFSLRSFDRYTNDRFIQECKEIHGDKYDYSVSKYRGIDTKFEFICPVHGVIEQTPYHHINKKHGCRLCGYYSKIPSSNKYNVEMFLSKCKEKWGDLYDYSKVDYVNSKTNVIIICKEHGEFLKRPAKHLQGQGCTKCGNSRSGRISKTKVNKKK